MDEIWWQEQLSKFIFNIISSVVIMVIFSQYVCLHQKVICSNCNHLEFICGYRWKIYFHGYTWILDTLYTKGNCCLMEAVHKFLVSKYFALVTRQRLSNKWFIKHWKCESKYNCLRKQTRVQLISTQYYARWQWLNICMLALIFFQ